MSPSLLAIAPTPAPAPTPTLAPVSVFSAAALVRTPAASLLAVPVVSLVCGAGVPPGALVLVATRLALLRTVDALPTVGAYPVSLIGRFGPALVPALLARALLRPAHLSLFLHTFLCASICVCKESSLQQPTECIGMHI